MMNRLLTILVFCFCCQWVSAQEIRFNITINTPKLQLVDPAIFQDMKNNLENFLNNQKWTNDVFEVEERIRVTVQMNITDEVSANSFKANMQIQAVRPVFGSNYETVLLSHNDKDVSFTYQQFQPLEFTKNSYRSNLESIFSFYVYVILGMDYDTFSPFGGEPHFQVAQNIMNNVPPSAASQFPGWRSLDNSGRNRYWMIDNILAPKVRPFRKAMYDYHRQGLDLMSDDALAGRAIMTQAIEDIKQVNRDFPNSMIIQMFVNAKSNEVVEIFKKGDSGQKSKVRSAMSRMDAANSAKYRKIGS